MIMEQIKPSACELRLILLNAMQIMQQVKPAGYNLRLTCM